MRGERDSLMLGEDASLEQNISLLKEIITEQRKLIRECVGENEPEMLALYKEVEAYYYGDETTPGLNDWDGLDGVTLMSARITMEICGHFRRRKCAPTAGALVCIITLITTDRRSLMSG